MHDAIFRARKALLEMNESNLERPKVGVGLFLVRNNNEILLAKRTASHGSGQYAGVGGHLENGESFEECIRREFLEEARSDLVFSDLRFLCLTNITKYAPKHYVDIGMTANYVSGKAEVLEPTKIESWDWYPLDNLPSPLFGSTGLYLQAYKSGNVIF